MRSIVATVGGWLRATRLRVRSILRAASGRAPLQLGGRAARIDTTAFVPAPIRSIQDWVPDDLRAAVAVSDTGDLRVVADLWSAIMGDDRAQSVMRTRVLALIGAKVDFAEQGEDKRPLRSAEASLDWRLMFPAPELEELLTWLDGVGVALGEMVWTEEDPRTGLEIARIRNGRNVPRLKVWNPRCLRKDVLGDQKWRVRLADGTEQVITPGDSKWILLAAGGARPWTRGLWRALGPLWLLKLFARDDLAAASEKFAKGVLAATCSTGSTPEDRKDLADQIRDMGRECVIALPEGWDLKVVQLNAGFEDIYIKQMDLANQSMAITAVGSNLPTEVKGGQGTGATLQGKVRQDYLEADAERAESELHAQGLRPWAEINFGNAELAPRPHYAVDPPEDRSALATTWKLVADFIRTAHETGMPVNVSEVMARFKMPVDEQANLTNLPPLFAYDYAAGIPTINEVRERKGLVAVPWGHERTTASNAAPALEQKAAA
jgi:phage gp29-like protein